jgi:signal transduction histidine kinase/ActR/RegA family two-component response regulator
MDRISPTLPFLHGDGQLRSLLLTHEWSTSPLGDPQTWPQELLTVVNLLLDSKFPMFMAWGPELGFLYNDEYARVLGDKHPGALGCRFQDVWGEIWSDIGPIIDKALTGKSSYFQDLPLTILRKGYPEQAWFTFSYSPVRDSMGVVGGMYCAVVETTCRVLGERRHAFQLQMADRLRPLGSPSEIIGVASELLGRYLDVSHVYYAEVDDANKTFAMLGKWHSGDLPDFPGTGQIENYGPALVDILRSGSIFVINEVETDDRIAQYRSAYAALKIRSLLVVPLVKAGRLAITLNLSKAVPYRWTDEDIAVAKDMAERTWAAAENAQSQAELREADRRKDEFLAMLAHELRNPLAPISAAAELMGLVQMDAAQLKQTSQVISRQVSHMTGLVNDLLDVSRVTRGLVAIDKSPQDLKEIVCAAVEQMRPIMEEHGHHLVIDIAPKAVHVPGDQKRLVQILANLLHNAAKYTPEGGNIVLRMEVRADQVLLSVRDNGIGIVRELQSRVFDLFAQGERKPDRTQGGLGLGLALVKSLVTLHGGTVACASDGPNKGSEFTVCLPRLLIRGGGPDRRTGKELRKFDKALQLMVVDDNEDAAQMLAMLLEALGHHVLVAHDPFKALELARDKAPDVCLLDIGLPGMDGNELARRLRKQPETAQSMLIAVTGYGQEQDRKNTQAVGFDYHLVKPVDAQKLAEILAGTNYQS